MRLAAYAGTSVALAAAIVLKALHSRPNFYSLCVYFAESNAALMILSNLVLLVLGSIMVGLQHVLYGPLRPIEIEQLYEKAWFAVTETCLAMTIFRGELGVWFVVMFVSLLVAKVWGWIGEGRLEILEQQPPENPRLFHARLSASLILSMMLNGWLLSYTIDTVRQNNRPDMMVMFAFEFALVNVSSLSTLIRYGITVQEALIVRDQTNTAMQAHRKEIESQRKAAREAAEAVGEPAPEEPPIEEVLDEADIDVPGWEEKSRWVFYLDLTTDFLRLILYLTFFFVLCRLYGMPIHIIRDVALVVRSFYRRVTDFIKYRHATRDMHARYPDATEEEIVSQDVCIICREGMRARTQAPAQDQAEAAPSSPLDERLRPKKLPCGHILHFACLRSWLERQQNCPTCRQPVLSNPTAQPNNGPNTPANNAAREPQPPANGNQAAQPNGNQANAQLNRMRTFNLGPLRLTVGTGQIFRPPVGGNAQIRGNPQNTQNPNVVLAAPTVDNQQTGTYQPFGTTATISNDANGTTIQSSINILERMLMQETIRLRLQTEQLNVLRAMQTELNRLRISQGLQQQSWGQTPTPGTTTPIPHINPLPQVSAFTTANNSEAIQSGSTNLPSGVVIPEGWTLLPLQRLAEQPPAPIIPNLAGLAPTQQRSRSLGPSQRGVPPMYTPIVPSNLPSVAVPSPPSPPASSMFVPTSSANPTTGQSQATTENNPQTVSTAPENNAVPATNPIPDPTPTIALSNESTTNTENQESNAEPERMGGWQWPTSPADEHSATAPTSVQDKESMQNDATSVVEQSERSHTTTVEDAPDED